MCIERIWICNIQVVLACGLIVLILGTAANINAEEEYSGVHHESEIQRVPLNLKQVEAKLDQAPIQSAPAMNKIKFGKQQFCQVGVKV